MTFGVVRGGNMPPEWPIIVGEIVHNLRSALDHLVWELVIVETGKSPVTNKTGFPVFVDQDGFNGRGKDPFLKGVGIEPMAFIETTQPFATGERKDSPLWHLHELSNWDKHRSIYVTGASSADPSIETVGQITPNTMISFRAPGPFENGTVMFKFSGPLGMHVKAKFAFHIAVKEPPLLGGLRLIDSLWACGQRVDCIVAVASKHFTEWQRLALQRRTPAV
jgi:hypothetical protein